MGAAIGQILGNAVRVAISPLQVVAGAKLLGDGLTMVG